MWLSVKGGPRIGGFCGWLGSKISNRLIQNFIQILAEIQSFHFFEPFILKGFGHFLNKMSTFFHFLNFFVQFL